LTNFFVIATIVNTIDMATTGGIGVVATIVNTVDVATTGGIGVVATVIQTLCASR
jgi:hypothetical protein